MFVNERSKKSAAQHDVEEMGSFTKPSRNNHHHFNARSFAAALQWRRAGLGDHLLKNPAWACVAKYAFEKSQMLDARSYSRHC